MPQAGVHAQAARMMRSLLFVPADSERKIPKAIAAGADAVILDLEDSVAPERKAHARGLAADVLTRRSENPRLFVRVNSLGSKLVEADINSVLPARPDGIVLPKSESGADVLRLGEMLIERGETGTIPIVGIATETARSLFHLGTYGDLGPRLLGLAWGMEDLATALG